MDENYSLNVFLNCPFDKDYEKLFNAILFTVHRCGFILKTSKEFDDTSKIRLHNIIKLIDESKYSIHDLSRVGIDPNTNLPRFNMPLELGIVVGSIHLGMKKHRKKEFLIIESEAYRFKTFISDIGGQDIVEHQDNQDLVIRRVRDWLVSKTDQIIPSAHYIIEEFKKFNEELPELCKDTKRKVEELTYKEFITIVINWLISNT